MASTETFPELPLFDLQLQPQDLEAVAETLRSGWLTLGPRTAAFEEAFAAHLGARHAVARLELHGRAAPRLPRRRRRPGRRGDRALVHLRRDRRGGALLRRARRCSRRSSRARARASTPRTSSGAITPRTKAVCVVHYAGYAAAADRLKELCDAHGIALIEDVAHAPSATLARAQARHVGPGGRVQLLLQQGPLGRRGRPAVHRRRRGRRVRALAPLARDDERHVGPPQRAHRHLRRRRARLQLPPRRAALRRCCSRGWSGWRRKSSAAAS